MSALLETLKPGFVPAPTEVLYRQWSRCDAGCAENSCDDYQEITAGDCYEFEDHETTYELIDSISST